jgi:Acyltransferase family.
MPDSVHWLPELDVLRATAILFLQFYLICVGFVAPADTFNYYFYWLGQFGLALFFFVSGYAIDLNNKEIRTRGDVGTFFRKRTRRIYPLYWLALSVIVLGPHVYSMAAGGQLVLPSPPTVALAATYIVGAQELFSLVIPGYVYLWFVSAILMLYVMYPIIVRYTSENPTHEIESVLVISTTIFAILIALNYVFSIIESRFFLYYFVFITGIIASRTNVFSAKVGPRRLFIIASFTFFITVAYQVLFNSRLYLDMRFDPLIDILAHYLVFVTTDLLLILVIFQLARRYYNAAGGGIRSAISYIAYASFCMYLFQGIFLGPTPATFFEQHLNATRLPIVAFQIFVALPILIIFSFNLQRLADKVIPRSKIKQATKEISQIPDGQ